MHPRVRHALLLGSKVRTFPPRSTDRFYGQKEHEDSVNENRLRSDCKQGFTAIPAQKHGFLWAY